MEFLKIVKRRSVFHEVIYVSLNIGLAIALMVLVKITGSLLPAFGLVMLSKWRVFAVRPRFWFANMQTNLVSTIVDVSIVTFLYIANMSNISEFRILTIQILLVLVHIAWLLFLKPKSKRSYVVSQAAVALFLGSIAIFSMSYSWIATPVVILVWLISYASTKHVLSSYDDESHSLFLSLAWAFAMTEIGWLAFHWTIAYRLPVFTNMLLPQVSILMLCFSFIGYKAYDSYYHHQKIRTNDILLPLIFTIGISSVLVFVFNSISTGI